MIARRARVAWWRLRLEADAQRSLLRAALLVRSRRPGTLARRADATAPADPARLGDARDAARAVARAAGRWPLPPRCLTRALALIDVLERRGIPGARLRVGVRGGPDGFSAHAWVELGSVELEPGPRLRGGYARIADLRPEAGQ